MTLETDFAPENSFVEFDSISTGANNIRLGSVNSVGTGDAGTVTFTGTLSQVPISDVTDIAIDGVSVGPLTVNKLGTIWTLSAPGLLGTASNVDSINGGFSITFSSAPGAGTALTIDFTSLNSEWSSISGIRENFRIFTDGGQGLVCLVEDPQFQKVVTPGTVKVPPTTTRYNPGEWTLRIPATTSVKEFLPRHVKSSLIIPEYLDSLQEVSIDEVQDAAVRLRNLRRWNVMDSEYLDAYLQTLGMFFKSEIFDIETRRRFIKELPAFLQLSGTRFTFNYLSFVVGAVFVTEQLWTSDYKSFIVQGDIPVGFEDLYYPTNHVQLTFDTEVFGVIDTGLIIDIFYVLASAPLVLERINQELTADVLNINAVMLGTYETTYVAEDVTP